jgi:PqqD family protein of HPr-rel-A system
LSQSREENAAAARPRWRAADPRTLDWAVWDSECVLFHLPSGKTHLVNLATHRLLADLLHTPLDLEQIEAGLGADWPAEERESLRAGTQELLWRLEELGLVEAS